MWATVKAALSKVWLWLLLALLVGCGVLFALLRLERARRIVAEARARNAEALAVIEAKRHQAALEEAAAVEAVEQEAVAKLAVLENEREQGEAEHGATVKEIDGSAGDDEAIRDRLKEALRRED